MLGAFPVKEDSARLPSSLSLPVSGPYGKTDP